MKPCWLGRKQGSVRNHIIIIYILHIYSEVNQKVSENLLLCKNCTYWICWIHCFAPAVNGGKC